LGKNCCVICRVDELVLGWGCSVDLGKATESLKYGEREGFTCGTCPGSLNQFLGHSIDKTRPPHRSETLLRSDAVTVENDRNRRATFEQS